jgi:hypothetical protein
MKKKMGKLSKQSFKWRASPDHWTHIKYTELKRRYANVILEAKKQHWEDFLEKAMEREMWTANKYLTEPVGDGGRRGYPH